MNELPYFKFMVDDWLAGRIQGHDMATQGIFLNVCARAWKSGGYVENGDRLARLLHVDKQTVANAIQVLVEDECLIQASDGKLSSKFILLQLAERGTLSEKRAKAGRKGGQAKHLRAPSKCQANAKQTSSKTPYIQSQSQSQNQNQKESTPIPPAVDDDKSEPSKKKKPYGEFGGVKLTDEEYEKLKAKHGESKLKEGIEILDDYMRSKGKRYKDHYAALKETSWVWESLLERRRMTNDPGTGGL